ncbi:TPA: hypothetical protein ACH7RB_005546, partial [Escherichia coli]
MNKSVTSALSEAADINSVIALVSSLERKETHLGRSSYVVTSKGAEVKTAFKVVDASSLIISNNLDGTINTAFPEELQPRDRTRLSSKLNRPGFPGECFICELRLPDHRFRWKHNK